VDEKVRKHVWLASSLTWVILVVLCLVLAAAYLVLTQCALPGVQTEGTHAEAPATADPATTDTTTDTTTTLPNPLVEHYNLEEMIATTGVPMTIPEGAEVLAISSINGEVNQVDVLFRGTTYTLRKARSTEADISGVYENWGTVEKMRAPDAEVGEVLVSRSSDKGIVTWNDGEFAHSIFAETGFIIANALMLVRP